MHQHMYSSTIPIHVLHAMEHFMRHGHYSMYVLTIRVNILIFSFNVWLQG